MFFQKGEEEIIQLFKQYETLYWSAENHGLFTWYCFSNPITPFDTSCRYRHGSKKHSVGC